MVLTLRPQASPIHGISYSLIILRVGLARSLTHWAAQWQQSLRSRTTGGSGVAGVNPNHVRAEVGFPMQVRVEREATVSGSSDKNTEKDGDANTEDAQGEAGKRFVLPPLRDMV
jgi:hypothetical protein